MKQCAEIMLEEILRHIRGETSLEEIHFVLFDERGLQTFQKTYSELAGKSLSVLIIARSRVRSPPGPRGQRVFW